MRDTISRDETAEKISINLPERLSEDIDGIWNDLESYLFQGFLTMDVSYRDVKLTFKTLNHNEIKYINLLKPKSASMKQEFAHLFIAYSLFLVDYTNVLPVRNTSIKKLMSTIAKIPRNVQDKIVENLHHLNLKASLLYPLTEVYVYENRSRFKWYHLNSSSIHSPSFTGIQGTDSLGLNYCQQTWTSLNVILDRRESSEREWANAKFIGGCFAGKGVKSIDEKDKARLETERTKRDERKLEILRDYLNGSDPSKKEEKLTRLPDGRMGVVEKSFKSSTVTELAEELSRAVSGEKDLHDLIVERKQKEAIEMHKSLESQKRQLLSVPDVQVDSFSVGGGGSSIIKGGKAAADKYADRMQALMEENRKKVFYQTTDTEKLEDENG